MSSELFAVAPDTGLESLARQLVARGISGAPVVKTDGSPCGVVSITDLVDPDKDTRKRQGYDVYYEISDKVAAEMGADRPESHPGRVEDVMSHRVVSVKADDDVEVAAQKMLDDSVHRLLVCEDGKLVGVVSTHDVMRALLESRR